MNDLELARARAVIEALREAERAATPGPWVEMDYADPTVVPLAAGIVPGAFGDADAEDSGDVFYSATFAGAPRAERNMAAIVALRNAAPALLALAEAARRMASIQPGDEDDEQGAWWIMGGVEVGEARTWCFSCGSEGPEEAAHYAELVHDPRCPAMAIDRALADLAVHAP